MFIQVVAEMVAFTSEGLTHAATKVQMESVKKIVEIKRGNKKASAGF
jgi:hypothetical protein